MRQECYRIENHYFYFIHKIKKKKSYMNTLKIMNFNSRYSILTALSDAPPSLIVK